MNFSKILENGHDKIKTKIVAQLNLPPELQQIGNNSNSKDNSNRNSTSTSTSNCNNNQPTTSLEKANHLPPPADSFSNIRFGLPNTHIPSVSSLLPLSKEDWAGKNHGKEEEEVEGGEEGKENTNSKQEKGILIMR